MNTRILLAISLAASLAACGTAKRDEPEAGPFVPKNAAERNGQLVFDRECSKCHTGGEAALGPGINDKPLPEFLMRTQVRVGIGAMPGFTEQEISDKELDELMAYMLALRKHGGGS